MHRGMSTDLKAPDSLALPGNLIKLRRPYQLPPQSSENIMHGDTHNWLSTKARPDFSCVDIRNRGFDAINLILKYVHSAGRDQQAVSFQSSPSSNLRQAMWSKGTSMLQSRWGERLRSSATSP
jgi:hypothetical protein